MKSVKTQVQNRPEPLVDEVQTVSQKREDTFGSEVTVEQDNLQDSLQNKSSGPSYQKRLLNATKGLGVSKKVTEEAFAEGGASLKVFRKQLRRVFKEDKDPNVASNLEELQRIVALEHAAVKKGKKESPLSKRDFERLNITLDSVISAANIVEVDMDEDITDTAEVQLGKLDEDAVEEVEEDMADIGSMDITPQDAEALLRADITEIEVVEEVIDWREFRQEEEYEVVCIRKTREEEEEEEEI